MILIEYSILVLEKRVPLTISRGTSVRDRILWLRWAEEEVEGWGEAVEFDLGGWGETLERMVGALNEVRPWLCHASAWERISIESRLHAEGVPIGLIAAIDQALLDWIGKKLGQPVWRLLGLQARSGPLTSVTVGISDPATARNRVKRWRETADVRAFKIKLGSPAGIAADQAMFLAVSAEVGPGIRLSVDANGGWSVTDACTMAAWLHEHGVDHLEQPLSRGSEANLASVRSASPLTLLADESCRNSRDVALLAEHYDGICIKLMKCGGMDEAVRMVAVARAHGLRILVGCYGNSALGNSAAAVLGPMVDYLDLDSHINFANDPFMGVAIDEGRLSLPLAPGFGVTHK